MAKNVINIEILSEVFNETSINININGFIFCYLDINYIITSHNFIPINNVSDDNNNRLDIILNSITNEVLILKYLPIHDIEYKINKIYQLKIPLIKTVCYILYDRKYKILIKNTTFISYNNITSKYKLPYIVANIIDTYDNISNMLGSPVYINNKLIGMLSKCDNDDNIFILPIYIIIKTILNINDNNLYQLENIKNIKKINSNRVVNNYIYNIKLKIDIPINTLILIEGNNNTELLIEYNNYKKLTKYSINDKFDIINNRHIIYNIKDSLNHYKLTTRLLNLIIISNINMATYILEALSNRNILELYFYINKNNIVFYNKE